MKSVRHPFVVLASVVVLAAGSAACGRHSEDETSLSSVVGPSPAGQTEARGGGRGGGGTGSGSSTLTLVMYVDKNGNGLPNWGDQVTFNISTTATTEPTVSLQCSQNGVVVYGATSGFYDGYPWPWTKYMTLSSATWVGGAAQCTATLFPVASRSTVLATVSFTAGA